MADGGKGNKVDYEEENTIKINYQDVDGDGMADRLVVNEDDNKMKYKT